MRNKNAKEVIEETKHLWRLSGLLEEEIEKHTNEALHNPPFKKKLIKC